MSILCMLSSEWVEFMKFMLLGIALIIVAIAIACHQFIFYGMWFAFEDLHHETWMIMFTFCGVVLITIFRGK